MLELTDRRVCVYMCCGVCVSVCVCVCVCCSECVCVCVLWCGEREFSLCVCVVLSACVCVWWYGEREREREWRYALCQYTGTERTAGHLHLDTTGRWAGRADPNTITSSSLC